MKKPELLAPAGNYDCLKAAINAGADAIYLAGKEFGARASADNFTEEELIKGLDLAHLHHKKIYLTLNTLIKEREFSKIVNFLHPLYEHGLDGIIFQDLGLIELIKDNFPKIELHASTQMTVTGVNGARFLKNQGVTRVVPARELSIAEMKKIREGANIEVECFIHGAMCYGYSGQCLFSSFLGGRSGNRGRCAGPCRLPYTIVNDNTTIKAGEIQYPLSLKDMCTIEMIGELIDAGIDSFKIEGRLKRPEYVAGVTSVYKKYIDEYLEDGFAKVKKSDIELLSGLYTRTKICDGYYHRHNGESMITKDNPSYNETKESIINEIALKYLNDIPKLKIIGHLTMVIGEPATLILKYENNIISYEGENVLMANNRPLSEDDVLKQLMKTGESFFDFEKLHIEMEDNCFMPVKALNELRRGAFKMLKEAIISE